MMPITLGEHSFRYGPTDIPYANVSGAGLGMRKRRAGVHSTLLIAYRLKAEDKPRIIVFGLERNADGVRFGQAFRAHVADRWAGEGPYFTMRNRLDFSNRLVFTIVALLVALTVVFVSAALFFLR
jgi:hypothetical protein